MKSISAQFVVFCCLLSSIVLSADEITGDYVLQDIATGLQFPKAMTILPSGEVLIAERDGFLTLVSNDSRQARFELDLPDLYTEGQGGVLDVLPINDDLLISYSKGSDDSNALAVVLAQFSTETGAAQVVPVYEVQDSKDTPVHYGGKLLALTAGGYLVTTGDGFDYREKAQLPSSHLGKIIGFTLSGAPLNSPSFHDNPYIYSYGHRNPQGLVYGADGNIYQHEHGPDGGDELNLIVKGANYGWPVVTRGKDYSGANISPFTSYQGMTEPLINWTPSIAPSSMAVYSHDAFPLLTDAFLITSLKAKKLFAVKASKNETGKAMFNLYPIINQLNTRLRDVKVDANGDILVLTDGADSRLIRVSPKP